MASEQRQLFMCLWNVMQVTEWFLFFYGLFASCFCKRKKSWRFSVYHSHGFPWLHKRCNVQWLAMCVLAWCRQRCSHRCRVLVTTRNFRGATCLLVAKIRDVPQSICLDKLFWSMASFTRSSEAWHQKNEIWRFRVMDSCFRFHAFLVCFCCSFC